MVMVLGESVCVHVLLAQAVLILPVGGSAINSLLVVDGRHFNENYFFRKPICLNNSHFFFILYVMTVL
jgi:hypothetical protein